MSRQFRYTGRFREAPYDVPRLPAPGYRFPFVVPAVPVEKRPSYEELMENYRREKEASQ